MPCNRDAAWSIERKTLQDALRWIHGNSLLVNLPIIAIIEGAPGTAGSNFSRHLDEAAIELHLELHYMRECPGNTLGVLKDAKRQLHYLQCLQYMLDRRNLSIDVNVATLHPSNTGMREIERLCSMIHQYHRDEVTGLPTSKVDGRPDDILSALNQLIYWAAIFWKNPLYMNIINKILDRSKLSYPFPSTGVIDTKPRRYKR